MYPCEYGRVPIRDWLIFGCHFASGPAWSLALGDFRVDGTTSKHVFFLDGGSCEPPTLGD